MGVRHILILVGLFQRKLHITLAFQDLLNVTQLADLSLDLLLQPTTLRQCRCDGLRLALHVDRVTSRQECLVLAIGLLLFFVLATCVSRAKILT